MPPLVFFALVGVGVVAGYKFLSARGKRGESETPESRRRAAAPTTVARDLGELEFDAESGVYRPVQSRKPQG